MTNRSNEFKHLAILNVIMIVFYAVLFFVSSFYDEKISEALYDPHSLVAMFISSIGAYPFFAFSVLFGGCLYERCLHSNLNKTIKYILCGLLILVITAVGFIGAGALVDRDSLGYIYPQLNRNIPVILCISLVSIFPLAYSGFRLSKNIADEKLLKRVISMLLIFVIAYVLLQIGKHIFHRPRSTDEPISRYTGGNSNLALGRILAYLFNPFAKDSYYYQIDIPAKDFMEYAARIDGSPNTILTAMMFKTAVGFLKEKDGTFISGKIAADYRDDIGASKSYRDFVRFIHVRYEWNTKNESIQKLNMHALLSDTTLDMVHQASDDLIKEFNQSAILI